MPRRKIPKQEEKKLEFIEAIKSSFGLLTRACDVVNINFQTYRNWYKKDPEFAEQVDNAVTDAYEKTTDMAEGKLYQAINKGEMTGIIFYLKTRGKKRGYIERQEITGKDGESLFTLDALKQIAKEIAKDES